MFQTLETVLYKIARMPTGKFHILRKDMPRGTLLSILDQAGISKEESLALI